MAIASSFRLGRLAPLAHSVSHNALSTRISFYGSFPSSLSPFPASESDLHKPLSSPFFSYPETESSDFDSESDEPIANISSPYLPTFVQILSQAKTQFSTQDEVLASLSSSFAFKPTKDLLYSALWVLRHDWESALLAFRWGGDCVLDSLSAWHLMIWVLGKRKRFDLAWLLVRKMHRKSLLTRRALVIMMERYASANEPGKAIKTFHAMEKFNLDADLATFYALVRTLCKHKNIEEAEELLLSKQKFFPLSAAGFNIVLDGWCNVFVDVIEAKRVWREMAKYCVMPDDISYTHMIGCFSKLGNLFDSLRLYVEMKKRGWNPTLKVFNYLIYVLTRENCTNEAQNIFHKIKETGLKPDVTTYNCYILPLCEAHKVNEAQDVMNLMISEGLQPSMETYHAFVKMVDFEGTLKLIDKMRASGFGPDGSTFLVIFDKFFRLGESENALKMWIEMRRNGVSPSALHYTTMIKGLAVHGWIPKAMEFCDEMKSKGFPADPKLERLFKRFISDNRNHWGKGGKGFVIGEHKIQVIRRILKHE
ncbi:hypothetical protein HPP92_010744 [Vanilla planifolia]|uniref:Pentatricopeptide repeat-containing protein n=1 Tax=Vanilla planifolia TaxID=51239 RepID=A0A835QUG9_VANPL|nr:hypothetical protein HPP92_010744 [Vanilla planifolia]